MRCGIELGRREGYADDSRDTIKASASTTPHRHFSQISCRHPPDQAVGPWPSPVPLAIAFPGVCEEFEDREVTGVAGVSRAEDDEAEGVIRAGEGISAVGDLGSVGEVGGVGSGGAEVPRSFSPML